MIKISKSFRNQNGEYTVIAQQGVDSKYTDSEKIYIHNGVIVDSASSISVSTDHSSYDSGKMLIVTGEVINGKGNNITLRVTSPSRESVVAIGQISLGSNGKFSATLFPGPTWTEDGFYSVTAIVGANQLVMTDANFSYSTTREESKLSGIENIPTGLVNTKQNEQVISEPDPKPTCGAGTELVNGNCQVIVDSESKPNSNEKFCFLFWCW